VSVVIVNYNAGRLLSVAVAEALLQAREVIVVDHASFDDSLSLLEAAFPSEPRLILIRVNANLGFAAGCNRGMAAATAPFVLFLNPDCVLQPEAIFHLMRALTADSHVGMVGGLLFDEKGIEQRGGRRHIPTIRTVLRHTLGLSRDFNLHEEVFPEKPMAVGAISGAMMLVSRQVQISIGLWDEGYFLHCEDLDLCMRYQQKGFKILFVPAAKAVHFQGTCSRSRPYFVLWHKHKSMVRFYRKFLQTQHARPLLWIVISGVWLRFSLVVIQRFFRGFRGSH